MPTPAVRQKVLCYVVRDERLLVFRHLDHPWDQSGLQVPAGSLKPHETPAEAALREASEETGLTTLRLIRRVGETQYDMRPYRPEIHHRHVFLLEAKQETPNRWVSREDDADDGSEPMRLECYWIPLAQAHVLAAGQGALIGHL